MRYNSINFPRYAAMQTGCRMSSKNEAGLGSSSTRRFIQAILISYSPRCHFNERKHSKRSTSLPSPCSWFYQRRSDCDLTLQEVKCPKCREWFARDDLTVQAIQIQKSYDNCLTLYHLDSDTIIYFDNRSSIKCADGQQPRLILLSLIGHDV